jgi:hypothetical protein
MYGEQTIDRNIRLSAIIFMLIESLKEIRDNSETLESAQNWADDAINLYDEMKEPNRGC